MNRSITEKLVLKLLNQIGSCQDLTEVDYYKCKLGLEIFFINVTKLFVIYVVSFLCGLTFETFILHCAFMSVRFFAYGAHATSNFVCTILSLLFCVGFPYILQFVLFPKLVLVVLTLLNFFLLNKYAPGKTEKNYLGNEQHQQKLRRNALLANGVIFIALLIPNLLVNNLMVLGSFMGGLFVVPITNKLFTLTILKGRFV